MSKEDDDVVIDFSKVKNLFSGKKKEKDDEKKHRHEEEHEKKHAHEHHEKEEHDVHKREKHPESEERASEDDVDEIDFREYWQKTKKFFNTYGIIFLVMIPIVLSLFLRLMPAYLPTTYDWAHDSIRNNIRAEISSQINQQYPNLPQQNKNQLINEQVNQYINSNPQQYQQSLTETAEYFKSRLQNEDGQTYLLAIDPYYWIFFAEDVLRYGHPGNEIRDGEFWTTYQNAPRGARLDPELHYYVDAYFYKMINFFNPDVDIWKTTFYLPVILATLGVIPAFFIAKKRGGNIAGLIAGFFVAVHSSFLSRTAGGFADTDAYNVVLPLYLMWFMVEALESKDLKRSSIFVVLASITLGIFKFAWKGWWYMYDFLLAALFIYVVYLAASNFSLLRKDFRKFLEKKNVKHGLATIGLFLVLSTIILSLSGSGGFRSITDAVFSRPLSIVELKDVGTRNIWPNVLTTVAELNPSSINQTINIIGGKFLFLLSLTGILFTVCSFMKKDVSKEQRLGEAIFVAGSILFYLFLISKPARFSNVIFLSLLMLPFAIRFVMVIRNRTKNIDIKYAALLLIWFVGTIYGSTRGVRFVMLLVPAFAVSLGIFTGVAYKLLTRLGEQHLKLSKAISVPIIIVLVYILIIASPWQNALATSKNQVPSMNDAWWNGLKAIQRDSEPDAIITSWWDFGHWFRSIAERPVTFDGASQGGVPAHWIGRSLLTEDEDMSVGILRMMDCSRNDAFDLLSENVNDLEAIRILDKILVVHTKDEARDILSEENLDEDVIEELLTYTHCQPPEAYYITSEDMVGKAGVWGHFGSWDFTKADMYFNVNTLGPEEGITLLENRYNMTREKAESRNYEIQSADPNQWISGWPGYFSGVSGCARQDDNVTHACRINLQQGQIVLVFNSSSGDAYVASQQGNTRPNSVSYVDENGEFVVKEFEGENIGYSFTMIKDGENYRTVMLDPLHAGGMFTKLFYHDGLGTEYFDKFYDARGITGGRIIIWKVDWDGKEDQSEESPLLREGDETEDLEEPLMNETEDNLLNNTDFSLADAAENSSEEA